MIKIKQGRLASAIGSFDFPGTYGLEGYTDRSKPCVFFGCYCHLPKAPDYKVLMAHHGLVIVVWTGSDILLIPRDYLNKIKSKNNIKHVAISGFIAKDLKRARIKYARLPLTPIKPKLDPQPLGDSIYCYLPERNKSQRNFYGGQLIDKLRRILPKEKFIFTHYGKYTRPQLREIYKKCFIGLRLTKHDGLSNTVMELGAMGRMCIYNDLVPNAIPWISIPDIAQKIIEEKKFIGQTKTAVAFSTCNFLNVSDDWLYTNFWK